MKAMETVNKIELVVAKEFSKTPGPRLIKEGEYSGELFRQRVLLPKFKEAKEKGLMLRIDLNGTAGYGTSFLEEAFGGLIRREGFSFEDVIKIIELISSEEEYLKDDIREYMKDAQNEKNK